MSTDPHWFAPIATAADSSLRPGNGPGQVALTVIMFVGYYMAARFGLLLQVQPEKIAVFWPAAGLSLGTLVALGSSARWPVSLAVLMATFVANVEHGAAPLTGFVFGLCNAAECLLGAMLLDRMFGRPFQLDSLGRVIGFIAATLVATAVAALPATLYLAHGLGVTVPIRTMWLDWLESDAVGIVTIAPVLLALPAALRERLPMWRLLEAGAILAVIATTAIYAFAHLPAQATWPTVAPIALLFPLLLWLAVRGTPLFAAAGAFAVALSIVYCVINGLGALGTSGQPLGERVFVAQLAILTLSFCTLTLSALVAEMRNALVAMKASEQRLRIATQAARVGVFELKLAEDQAVWENERMYELFAHTHHDGTFGYARFRERYLDPADRDKVERAFQQTLATGQASVVCRVRRKDGVWRDLDIIGLVDRSGRDEPTKLVGVMADITEQRQSEARQALLMGELDHRVKNALDLVLRLLDLTRSAAVSKEDFAATLRDRIDALARAHQLLGREHWTGVGLAVLVAGQLEPYADHRRVVIDGPPMRLNDRATQTFCLVLHELATNAAKYGALSNQNGRVEVRWSIQPPSPSADSGNMLVGEKLIIDWRESGGPPVAQPQRFGFGSRLIRGSIAHEQQGSVHLEFQDDGVRCRISVPLDTVVATADATDHVTRSSETERQSISNSRSTTGGRQ